MCRAQTDKNCSTTNLCKGHLAKGCVKAQTPRLAGKNMPFSTMHASMQSRNYKEVLSENGNSYRTQALLFVRETQACSKCSRVRSPQSAWFGAGVGWVIWVPSHSVEGNSTASVQKPRKLIHCSATEFAMGGDRSFVCYNPYSTTTRKTTTIWHKDSGLT